MGALAVLAGVIAYGYARMGYDDFGNPNVSFWTAILGTGLISRVNPWARGLVLGALSFFPGFIVSAVPATLLVSKRWPGDIQADNIALLTSVFVGTTLAVVVCVVLIRTRNRKYATPADNC
ncbi:MAG: hypothetical protein DMG96_31350 [Acidobacteria bacterium]|nr:MAG: hypothetical protein DMG96_31350 [Acidobacteriota bacterium]